MQNCSSAFLARLLRDPAGNTMALVAAALFPLLAMVGGAIDIGRGYLSQSRLQQACDAGVLATRKRLGTSAMVAGSIPADIEAVGYSFFNLNFDEGAYGTGERTFAMELHEDFSVSGTATLDVSTTIMRVFGYNRMPITVECEAQLNMANTDIMMVLDVTGSMAEKNPGDDVSRMDVMKATVRDFYAELSGVSPGVTRVRFGFLPYSTNVNVGHLLADNWVNTSWHYQSREARPELGPITTRTYDQNWRLISGSVSATVTVSSYPATYRDGSAGYTYVNENEQVITVPPGSPTYTCDRALPANTFTSNDTLLSTATEPFPGPPEGTRTIRAYERYENGDKYSHSRSGTTCNVRKQTFNQRVQHFDRITDPAQNTVNKWLYDRFTRNVANWRAESNGCIEERATYQITDYGNVDLARAKDLDIDLVPTSDPDTRWSPMYPQWIYERSMNTAGSGGSFTKPAKTVTNNYFAPLSNGFAACPARARKLGSISATELDAYLATLVPTGQTYHDIGMIWGARMLSPNGIFASENADVSSTRPSNRHLIFLTDGETEPRDLSYSSYGVEPLDERRWKPGAPFTLTQTVENRFAFACQEARKRNITIWTIAFGTADNPVMETCSGSDRYFVADDAAELRETFSTIAKRMGELRVTR